MKAGPSNGKVYTEEDWNTESGPDKEGGYMYSKVVHLHTKSLNLALVLCLSQALRTHSHEHIAYVHTDALP